MLSDVTGAGVRERQQTLKALCETARGSWLEPKDSPREALKQMWAHGKINMNKMKRFRCQSLEACQEHARLISPPKYGRIIILLVKKNVSIFISFKQKKHTL